LFLIFSIFFFSCNIADEVNLSAFDVTDAILDIPFDFVTD